MLGVDAINKITEVMSGMEMGSYADWLSGISTLMAVILSLYLAFRTQRRRIKIHYVAEQRIEERIIKDTTNKFEYTAGIQVDVLTFWLFNGSNSAKMFYYCGVRRASNKRLIRYLRRGMIKISPKWLKRKIYNYIANNNMEVANFKMEVVRSEDMSERRDIYMDKYFLPGKITSYEICFQDSLNREYIAQFTLPKKEDTENN